MVSGILDPFTDVRDDLLFVKYGRLIPKAALILLPGPGKGELDCPYSAHFLILKLFELISTRRLGRWPTERKPSWLVFRARLEAGKMPEGQTAAPSRIASSGKARHSMNEL